MLTTSAGVVYEELPGSPTFSGSRDGPKATRVLKIAWSDVDTLLGEFFPEAIETGNGWIFPVSVAFPGKTWLQALDYSVKPYDGDNTTGHDANGVRDYSDDTGAEVTINYGIPPYDPNREDQTGDGQQILADHSIAFSAEMLKLGTPGWRWSGVPDRDDPGKGIPITNEDASLGKLVPSIEHTLTWNYVPSPPFYRLAQLVGCVNADTALFSAPVGTLLFSGAELRRSYTTTGAEAWKATFKFLQRWIKDVANVTGTKNFSGVDIVVPAQKVVVIGWNHVYNPLGNAWDMPYRQGPDGQYHGIYEYANLATLFDRDTSDDTR